METHIQSGRERLDQWRRKLAIAGIGVLLCLAAYYVVFSANGLMVYQEKRRESQELDRQIKALQQQNSSTEKEIKALKSDPETIEKEARERLRYARPGEVIYTIPTAPAASPPAKK
ncbi:MAG TPA: septum formation initiator family protein [Candidatus Sulfotelmatobacter sp.]|nr:septum formation initiator family protein [Candidatus Sulfotelmatobacter sp.]